MSEFYPKSEWARDMMEILRTSRGNSAQVLATRQRLATELAAWLMEGNELDTDAYLPVQCTLEHLLSATVGDTGVSILHSTPTESLLGRLNDLLGDYEDPEVMSNLLESYAKQLTVTPEDEQPPHPKDRLPSADDMW